MERTDGQLDAGGALQSAIEHHVAGRLDEAEAAYRLALGADPNLAVAHTNLGFLLQSRGDLDGAEAHGRSAVELAPGEANAHYNLGVVCHIRGRLEEAEACYGQTLRCNPDHIGALHNMGFLLHSRGQREAAEALYRHALRVQPSFVDAHFNLATLLDQAGNEEGARAEYETVTELEPAHVGALNNLGGIAQLHFDFPRAVEFYGRALAADPENGCAATQMAHCRQYLCAWEGFSELLERVKRIVAAGKGGQIFPFSFIALPVDAAEHLDCARQYAGKQLPAVIPAHVSAGVPRQDSRLRLAYLSADFHQHATAYLIAEMIELHDRSRFELFGYSIGPKDNGPMRQRLMRGFEHFADISDLDDQEAAELIRHDGIDILVDLKGYTRGHRVGILGHRPAPLQVQFVGYPGTMGTPCVDYLIADEFIVPEAHFQWYDEKIVWLPGCYQPNDRKREVGDMPTRAEAGLPADGVVFCAFHQSYKILPDVFDCWMRLLQRVPGSVLWLLESNVWAPDNLRREAAARGVNPGRLLFSPNLPLKEHLGRLQLADVYLDAWVTNAHTTASDALWVGLPVVTLAGETFASRVAGSLLRAAEVPELVATRVADYEEFAVALALAPERRAALRSRLREQRDRVALFDAPRFTHGLEAAFESMWQRHERGLAPDHLSFSCRTQVGTAESDAVNEPGEVFARANEILGMALAHHREGRLDQAEACYRQALDLDPGRAAIHTNLGFLVQCRGEMAQAESLYRHALELDPGCVNACYNLGVLCHNSGRTAEAEHCFRQVVQLAPESVGALHNLGFIMFARGDFREAEAWLRRAVEIDPDYAEAHGKLASTLQILGDPLGAETHYSQALALNPTLQGALNSLVNMLMGGGGMDAAEHHVRRALQQDSGNAEAHYHLATVLNRRGLQGEAEGEYLAALDLCPEFTLALNDLGNLYYGRRDLFAAENYLRRVLQTAPENLAARNNLGSILYERGDLAGAEIEYRRAIELDGSNGVFWSNLANVQYMGRNYPAALESYRHALELAPDSSHSYFVYTHLLQHLCAWEELPSRIVRIKAMLASDGYADFPAFMMLPLPTTREERRRGAHKYAVQLGCGRTLAWPEWRHLSGEKLRVGFLSADLREHPISHLIAELVELLDRRQFEVFAYSIGADDGSDMRQRMVSAFDCFRDVGHLTHEAIADTIRADGVDVLLDLMGYTTSCRPWVLAYRPAPVQAQFLGFLGTMGTPIVDYLLADEMVVPESHFPGYEEKVVWLPGCFQPNDRQRPVGVMPGRDQVGLPAEGVVYCAFHQSIKITPDVFDSWMRLLLRVSGSVLWLLETNPWMSDNLRREARARGVDAARIIFSPARPRADYLAQMQLADMYLDTWTCNGGTTVSDALWAGLPVVTRLGETLPARMAASLVRAAGLPELVTESARDYEELAYELATDAQRRLALKRKLHAERGTMSLFDTPRYARGLERALRAMWERHRRGEAPGHIALEKLDSPVA